MNYAIDVQIFLEGGLHLCDIINLENCDSIEIAEEFSSKRLDEVAMVIRNNSVATMEIAHTSIRTSAIEAIQFRAFKKGEIK